MREPRKSFIWAVIGVFVTAATAGAAEPTSEPIRFGSDAIHYDASGLAFAETALGFADSAIAFSDSAIVFSSTPMQMETASTVEITLPADVLFDFDKADIRATARSALQEVADLIRQKAKGAVSIQGYTDGLGADGYNQKLSERRAASVKAWLIANEKLPASRFATQGLGRRNPVAPNTRPDGSDDPDGRQLNRRVTFIIRK